MITKVAAWNFLPFREPVQLDFAGKGVVLVRGEVRVSQAVDSNGAGKTSIPSIVCFAYFGEDLLGRKGDAVANRFTDGECGVRVFTEDALGEWSVTRTRRPATLRVTGIPGVAENEDMRVVQEKIEQRLGFGLRTFKNAVVFGQGRFERFSQADQAEQMRMLDEIQGIDFKDWLARAKAWRDDLQDRLSDAESEAEALGRERLSLVEARAAFEKQRDGFVKAAAERVTKLEADLEMSARRRSLAEVEIVAAAESAKALVVLRVEIAREEELDPTALFQKAFDLEAEWSKAKGSEADLLERLDNLVSQSACPTCSQPVKTRKKAVLKLFEPEIRRLRSSAEKAEKAWKEAADDYNEAVVTHARQVTKVAKLIPGSNSADQWKPRQYLAVLEERCGAKQAQLRLGVVRQAEQEIAKVKAEIESARSEKWSGQRTLDEYRAKSAEADRRQVDVGATHVKLVGAVELAGYCVEALGDRGVRSMLADGVADYLNGRIAAHLEVLACGEASNRMSTQTELKKGGARERISFRPAWSWGGDGAGTGSGGQDRRMDLATFAAAQDLAESRSARPFPVKVFDEPFDALDGRGMELAAEWIRRQARDRGTVLLITHSREMEALVDPDETWTVVLDEGGARVEVS